MPETSVETVRCGQNRTLPKPERSKHLEEPHPPSQTPPPQERDVAPPTTGSQSSSSTGVIRQKQQRPSVLRQLSQTASRRQHAPPGHSAAVSVCKEEVDAGRFLHSSSSPGQSHYFFSSRREGAKQSSTDARLHDGIPEATSALFVSGFCCWPGCDAVTEDFHSFLKHLRSEHSHSDRSVAQWKVQKDIVQRMESQLILEKQKLVAMQLHLHLSEHKHNDLKASSDWPYSLPLYVPQPLVTDGEAVQQWALKHLEEMSQHGPRAAASSHFLPELIPSIEFYKYNNVRPPYTYAYLIRWSILECPDNQRTLNEIYNWFTTMFFYFRHNTATWKNAVRHNLSLHKCFVRVEGGKGAVWTVDETEYQRRKGQKYHRDGPVKWLKSYSHYCPEEP
ncbi:forkhead box protein P1 [Notolabrus celidotus]|uniref:forkhead box protein P1 n=1 Tax=Notolabrus celidotus TaxID=1203425 RepID=UPI00148F87E9|nr:forkhead box protein P1 [Notolabrus celidotus]XP_034551349.1 forkhead box protein P1 [Notolabrus celidotus]XP_034551350.1 forkhead box protein P1 [Notolabrus celidotus]XP_034551351.1 forkhead box protein P1 [Notolabrus celidotus]XP_034551352.1 forkhead box protein P1 [Notolabrus celidotus]XP_034551353.1 forkhead box protein P1 [Notolabrus celidotus]